jgi:hypothetical protein
VRCPRPLARIAVYFIARDRNRRRGLPVAACNQRLTDMEFTAAARSAFEFSLKLTNAAVYYIVKGARWALLALGKCGPHWVLRTPHSEWVQISCYVASSGQRNNAESETQSQ